MVLNLSQYLLIVLGGVWTIGVTVALFFLLRSFSRLTTGTKQERLDEILSELRSDFQKEHLSHKIIERELLQIRSQLPPHLQKIGLVRFNPFVATGGNQSFSLAILDGEDSGLVLTSLHSRDGTRLYAKPIKHGKAQNELSREEEAALKSAKTIKNA